jgi:hypothetical protein
MLLSFRSVLTIGSIMLRTLVTVLVRVPTLLPLASVPLMR